MHSGRSFIESYPAVPESVPRGRVAVTAFAAAAGVTGYQLDSIRLAASEGLTNAILHAYQGRAVDAGHVHVSASVVPGELWLRIADDGRGVHAGEATPGLGLGLALIAELSDEFEIAKRPSGGTELRMRFELATPSAPAGDYSGESVSSATAPASPSFSKIT